MQFQTFEEKQKHDKEDGGFTFHVEDVERVAQGI